MHDTAKEYGAAFFNTYIDETLNLKIVDVGSQDVNGSLRSFSSPNHQYVGVDFVDGKGVDVIIRDPYSLPFDSESVNVVLSSSCFEHSEFFWLLFNEALRILKSNGLLYLNVPSNGLFHRYPVDCWRFYPDSGVALVNWGKRSGYKCALLESFIGERRTDIWNDFVAVFSKDEHYTSQYPHRIQEEMPNFLNGHIYGRNDIINYFGAS